MRSGRLLMVLILGLSLMVSTGSINQAAPMGTAFTYQGRFIDSNSPADGAYDFKYTLYDNSMNGTQIGNTICKENLGVINGYFTTELDFGPGAFDGNARWLEIGVRPGDSSGAYDTLNPRQELTPVPYAIRVDVSDNIGGSGTTGYVPKFSGSRTVADSSIFESSGNVGIGTTSPNDKLEIKGPAGSNHVRISNTVNSRYSRIGHDNTGPFIQVSNNGDTWSFRGSSGNELMTINPNNGFVGIGTTTPAGRLDVNGSIYQRGTRLHADYVFAPNYTLESVEEHARFMWQQGHLKAVPKAEINDDGQEVVDLGAHLGGAVEELEKAHIYIEQLHHRIKTLEDQVAKLEAKASRTQ